MKPASKRGTIVAQIYSRSSKCGSVDQIFQVVYHTAAVITVEHLIGPAFCPKSYWKNLWNRKRSVSINYQVTLHGVLLRYWDVDVYGYLLLLKHGLALVLRCTFCTVHKWIHVLVQQVKPNNCHARNWLERVMWMHAYESVTIPWHVFVLVEWGVYIEHFHHMITTPYTKAVNVSVFGLSTVYFPPLNFLWSLWTAYSRRIGNSS